MSGEAEHSVLWARYSQGSLTVGNYPSCTQVSCVTGSIHGAVSETPCTDSWSGGYQSRLVSTLETIGARKESRDKIPTEEISFPVTTGMEKQQREKEQRSHWLWCQCPLQGLVLVLATLLPIHFAVDGLEKAVEDVPRAWALVIHVGNWPRPGSPLGSEPAGGRYLTPSFSFFFPLWL